MSSSACLVVSPPEYEEPQRTAPFLVPGEAFPDLRQTIIIKDQTVVEFGGAVLSEDNGVPVELALYVDYGQENAAGRPYRNVIYPFEPIPPGTIADGPRKFQGRRWYLDIIGISPGCHTITMMASHDFDANVCPADIADSNFLVWQVFKCDASGGPCDTIQCEPLTCEDQQCPTCATLAPDAGADGGAL